MSLRHPTGADGSHDIIRRAFDTVSAVQRVRTMEELNAVVHRSFSDLGFSTYVGLRVLGPAGRPMHAVMFGATHQGWEEHYAERQYARHDSVLRQLVRSVEPIIWSDLSKQGRLSAIDRNIYGEAAEFGLTDGMLTPIPHLDGSLSAVLLAGRNIDAGDAEVRSIGHLLSLHYGAVAQRLQHQAQRLADRPGRLTGRQIECLKWTRHGKSSADIGEILSISAKTVDEHLAEACSRLGVRTRTQAAVEAALMGLID